MMPSLQAAVPQQVGSATTRTGDFHSGRQGSILGEEVRLYTNYLE